MSAISGNIITVQERCRGFAGKTVHPAILKADLVKGPTYENPFSTYTVTLNVDALTTDDIARGAIYDSGLSVDFSSDLLKATIAKMKSIRPRLETNRNQELRMLLVRNYQKITRDYAEMHKAIRTLPKQPTDSGSFRSSGSPFSKWFGNDEYLKRDVLVFLQNQEEEKDDALDGSDSLMIHTSVLVTKSPVIKGILENPSFAENRTKTLDLKALRLSSAQKLLKFFYDLPFEIESNEEAQELFHAGVMYEIPSLQELCRNRARLADIASARPQDQQFETDVELNAALTPLSSQEMVARYESAVAEVDRIYQRLLKPHVDSALK